MKTIKELEKCLNVVKNKGYLLSGSSDIDYDIDKIINKNLEETRSHYFNKYNVLKLKDDKIQNFRISDSKGSKKDFKEIKKEIKEYFSKRDNKALISEVLKEVNLSFRYPKGSNCYYDMHRLSFEEIEENLNKQHMKELVFKYCSSYSIGQGVEDTLSKIIALFNLVLNVDIYINYNSLNYNSSLQDIKQSINTQQGIFKINNFHKGNIKIKFNDKKMHETIRNLLIDDKLKTYSKEYYILLDVLDKEDLFNLNSLIIYTNKINCFANLQLNVYQHKYFVEKYSKEAILNGTTEFWNKQDNFSCVAHIAKSDSYKYAIARIDETDFNDYLKRTASEIALSYCNFNCGLIKSLK